MGRLPCPDAKAIETGTRGANWTRVRRKKTFSLKALKTLLPFTIFSNRCPQFCQGSRVPRTLGEPAGSWPRGDAPSSPRWEVWDWRSSWLESPWVILLKGCDNRTARLNCLLFLGCRSALQAWIARSLWVNECKQISQEEKVPISARSVLFTGERTDHQQALSPGADSGVGTAPALPDVPALQS